MKKNYDYIVYGGNLSALLFAKKKFNEGNSVLLINRYGFLGGSLTEALSLKQNFNEEIFSEPVKEIAREIKGKKYGLLSKNNSSALVNPESLKIVYQNFLTESGVEFCFHLIPKKFESDNEIILIAREGDINISAEKFFDASEDLDMIKLFAKKRTVENIYYNVLTTIPRDKKIPDFEKIESFNEIYDGRFFVKLIIEDKENYEAESQKILNAYNAKLLNVGSRIQLVPSKAERNFSYDFYDKPQNFSSVEELTGNKFSKSEQFLAATYIENNLDKF